MNLISHIEVQSLSARYAGKLKVAMLKGGKLLNNNSESNSPISQYEHPARLRLPVPHVSTKPLKSSLSLHAKILFYV